MESDIISRIENILNHEDYEELRINWKEYYKFIDEELTKLNNEETVVIRKAIDKQIRNRNFDSIPPFTIMRILEILLDPQKNGYNLQESNRKIKLFNGLNRLFLVDSNITEFATPYEIDANN